MKKKSKNKKIYFIRSLPFISTLLIITATIIVATLIKYDLSTIENKKLYNFSTKQQFIKDINVYAQVNYKKYNIYPSITIAQAILESDWGKSRLSSEFNNFFGIKSIKKDDKNKVVLTTNEYVNNKKIEIKDAFKVYSSLEDSVKHHGALIGTAPIYKRVVQSKNYKEAANMLYKCGYATDPRYPSLLIELIEQYELYKFD